MNRKIIFLISLIFVLFSFAPSFFEIFHIKELPKDRVFSLDHNYMLDYNFYLSRIRQGQEGNMLVTEKYYNQPHSPSLLQILYLYLGKIGKIFRMDPPAVYHASRLIFGFILLYLTGEYIRRIIDKRWQVWTFLLVVTSGSFPILVKAGTFWRFATYMGWWSAIDSLQRATFIPHVLFGQIFILVFIMVYSNREFFLRSSRMLCRLKILIWSLIGLIVGIVFPPTLIIVYVFMVILSVFELFRLWSGKIKEILLPFSDRKWISGAILPRIIFIAVSAISFIYMKMIFMVPPWSELPLFDIRHRFLLPYAEYARALGFVLPLGVLGLAVVFIRREKKLISSAVWIFSLCILFMIFERVPEQSPLRFTEGLFHIPLGILSGYFLLSLCQLARKIGKRPGIIGSFAVKSFTAVIIVIGLGVMCSMYLWLTDNLRSKYAGGWLVPIGAQIAYPLKDFMDAVKFIGNNTKKEEVVMTFVTAGNFIPAYAGNYVYIGHINTPDETPKEGISANFYAGKMGQKEASDFLKKERISYIFIGPQEKEYGNGANITASYPDIKFQLFYSNPSVTVYKIQD
jgi:hypothetical protein